MSAETMEGQSDPAEVFARIEACGRRVETPCGEGTMVWRIWGEGEPLILAHGAQGSWSHWIANIDALSQGRMVVAADMPGHGDSALPPSDGHAGISAVLAEGLGEIVGDRFPVDLVGFSFGGVVFAQFAARYPEMVRRLILVGCGGLGTPHGHVDLRRVGGLQGKERQAALKANLLGLMLHHPERADDIAIHQLVTNARRARLKNAADLVLPDRLVEVLPDIEAPVDAIWGAFDRPHPDPHLQEEVLRRFQPAADFRVVADSGHWVMYERPEAFNGMLLAMLDAPLRPAR